MVKGGSRFDDAKKRLSEFDSYLSSGSKYGPVGKDGSKKINFDNYDLSGLSKEYKDRFNDGNAEVKFQMITDNNLKRKPYNYNGVRYKTIGVITVLSVLSIIMSILVADIYNNSSKKITEDETAQGAYTYVISSITAVLAVLVTLIISLSKQYKLIMFMILFGIFGIVTSSIGLYWINNDPDMSKKYSKDKKNFLIFAIFIWIMVIIGGVISMAL